MPSCQGRARHESRQVRTVSNGRPHRRRLSAAQGRVGATLGPLDGARIPGGCPDCDAYQTVAPKAPGVWTVAAHHDDGCATYARVQAH